MNSIGRFDNLKIFFPDISGPAIIAGDKIKAIKINKNIIFSYLNFKIILLVNFLILKIIVIMINVNGKNKYEINFTNSSNVKLKLSKANLPPSL